jgi:threonine synthase
VPNHDVNYFIAWWATVYARLAYLNPQQFLGRYTQIFGSATGTVNDGTNASANDGSGGALPTTSILTKMQNQSSTNGIMGLLDDKTMLGLSTANVGEKRWGLNVIPVDGINTSTPQTPTLTLDCVTNYNAQGAPSDVFGPATDPNIQSWSERVNIILGERRISDTDLNCAPSLPLSQNPMLVFRAISDSNYGTTYVFGDKRAPKLVWIVFRGTANAKSALSYTRPGSLLPTNFIEFFSEIENGLEGIFKILQEQIHMIIQMAADVAKELNPGTIAPGSIKLQVTGHSLGGALATAFAGEYVQQISPSFNGTELAMFDISIGCWSIASPRIFGEKEAALFCCLTQSEKACAQDPNASNYVKVDSNVKGRIAYLRVVTALDIVTALPKGNGYAHPCSDFKNGDERTMVTMDCDIDNGFVTNKRSTRCASSKRPSMTANFATTAGCSNQRKSTFSMSSIFYHLTYCGIMFAGGVDMDSIVNLGVERLEAQDVQKAAAAGIKSVVLVPEGKIALGKLSQAVAHKAQILQVQGNFDDCLTLARDLSTNYPVHLVNSVNPDRIEGQKTAAFEVVDALGQAPDFHVLPVGNAGNYSAYFKGYQEDFKARRIKALPKMYGYQAEGSAPFVQGSPVKNPDTIATAIRIGNPASWDLAQIAREKSKGKFGAVSDKEILWMHRFLSQEAGVFVEPSSATGAAGLYKASQTGESFAGALIVITVTGHGLKDPGWALKDEAGNEITPEAVSTNAAEVAERLGLA